jgi:hypothetical protein
METDQAKHKRLVWEIDKKLQEDEALRRSPDAEPQAETVRRRSGSPRPDPRNRPLARRPGIVQDHVMHTVGGIVFPGSPLVANQGNCSRSPATGPI